MLHMQGNKRNRTQRIYFPNLILALLFFFFLQILQGIFRQQNKYLLNLRRIKGLPFSILCLTRDFIRQGHAREKRKVYRATRTRSQAIDRG